MKDCIITRNVLINVFLFIGINSFSQTMQIESIKQEGTNLLVFELKIKNTSKSPLNFYKPNLRDLCNGILSINLKSKDNKVNSPDCDFDEHLDTIYLSCNNTIILANDESFSFYYKIKRPKYLKEFYKVNLTINYEDVNFVNKDTSCKTENFDGTLTTNYIVKN